MNSLQTQLEDIEWTNGKTIGSHVVKMIDRLEPYIRKGERVLDMGCRTGGAMEIFRLKGMEAEGVEIIESYVKVCRDKGFKVTLGDVTHLDDYFETSYFHLLFGSHIIEHLEDPKLALSNMAKVIVPGGVCALMFPREAKGPSRVAAVNLWGAPKVNKHLAFFNTDDEVRRIIGPEWEIISCHTFFPYYWIENWELLLRRKYEI